MPDRDQSGSDPTLGLVPGDFALFQDSLFAGVDVAPLTDMLSRCLLRQLEPGQILLSLGQPNHSFFLLLSGELQVHLDALGSPASLPVRPGEGVGDLSLIDGGPVSAFVLAGVASRVLEVPGEVFWSGFMANQALARNLMRMVVGRLRDRAEMILEGQRRQLRLEALEREVDAARIIQANMLPSQMPLCSRHQSLDIHARMDPAREVGGDFYEVMPLDGQHVLLGVGDVAGKGMAAALFMVRGLTVLRMTARRGEANRDLLARVNTQLCENNPGAMFMTALIGVLNAADGSLALYNGGHPPPLLSRAGAPFVSLSLPKGLVLGVLPGRPYPPLRLTLAPGDRLMIFSDGVTEAENVAREQFGRERLTEVLNACQADTAAALVADVHQSIQDFVGEAPQSDDITLMVIRVLAADEDRDASGEALG